MTSKESLGFLSKDYCIRLWEDKQAEKNFIIKASIAVNTSVLTKLTTPIMGFFASATLSIA